MHAIWPFLWIWATLYREDRGWGFSNGKKRELILEGEVRELMEKVEDLNQRLASIETPKTDKVSENTPEQQPKQEV